MGDKVEGEIRNLDLLIQNENDINKRIELRQKKIELILEALKKKEVE